MPFRPYIKAYQRQHHEWAVYCLPAEEYDDQDMSQEKCRWVAFNLTYEEAEALSDALVPPLRALGIHVWMRDQSPDEQPLPDAYYDDPASLD